MSPFEDPAAPYYDGSDYDIALRVTAELAEGGKAREFLSEHLLTGSLRLADFGCWRGRNIPALYQIANQRSASGRVIGIDHPRARERVEFAREANSNNEFRLSSLTDLDLPEASIDGGICWRVLHNLTRPGELLAAQRELFRVLKPGAPLVIAVRATSVESAERQPVPLRTFNELQDRVDLYFQGPNALRQTFGFFFEIVGPPRLIDEGESFTYRPPGATGPDGDIRLDYMNRYWVVDLLRKARPSRETWHQEWADGKR